MMYKELLPKIDAMIEESDNVLEHDTIKLVNIKSVKSDPKPGAPFGKGPKKVLDKFMKMGKKRGYYVTDYKVGVVSAAMKQGLPDLGIWVHGDVVPEGDGWRFKPYRAKKYKGCIIGRGATDNKGQLAAVLCLFDIFKKLGIKLNYNPAIYVGSNEETGMLDITGMNGNPDARGFINVATPPKLSLVPDAGFPMVYGGKGGATLFLRSKTPLHCVTVTAGRDDSPGSASATFASLEIPDSIPDCTVVKDKATTISTFTPPRHGSNPDPNGNMITLISRALLSLDALHPSDRYIFEFFEKISTDILGECLDIKTEHPELGDLTVFSSGIETVNGYAEIRINIRYPLGITFEKIVENIEKTTEKVGFMVVRANKGILPYILDKNSEVVTSLTEISNEIIGEDKKPYTIKGGTYAHVLPNAYPYGMNGNLPPDDFPKGRGGAHGIDEAVSVARLKRAMRIYARAMLKLNEIEWR